MGAVSAEDAGKTIKFSGLFGWYGGEPMRVHQGVVMIGQHAPRRHALAEGLQHCHKLLTERRHTLGGLRDVGKMLVAGGAQ